MSPVKAVLFDRDGTLVHDVPYNGDPERVRPVEGAREAVALLRAHGIRVGVVTNQSGVARGLITDAEVRRVNRRIDDLIGPFDVWAVCPHGPDDGCRCRKPQPGLVLWAAGRLCTAPADCVVIGDIGADTDAAERAGAHGILVPNARTRPQETATAPHVAPDLLTAVRTLLDDEPSGQTTYTTGTDTGPTPTATAPSKPTSTPTADAPAAAPGDAPAAPAPSAPGRATATGRERTRLTSTDARGSAAADDRGRPAAAPGGARGVAAPSGPGRGAVTGRDRTHPTPTDARGSAAADRGRPAAAPGGVPSAPGRATATGRERTRLTPTDARGSADGVGQGFPDPEAARTHAAADTRRRSR